MALQMPSGNGTKTSPGFMFAMKKQLVLQLEPKPTLLES
jgi:hypothetical protein